MINSDIQMKTIKLKKEILLDIDFISQVGINVFDLGLVNVPDEKPVPPTKIKFDQFNIVNIVDVPARKMVYVDLVETIFPLIIWRGKDYDKKSDWTRQEVYSRASKLLNTSKPEQLKSLFDMNGMSIAITKEEFENIEKETEVEIQLHPRMFMIRPRYPFLPTEGI